jgi:hypothetical protein
MWLNEKGRPIANLPENLCLCSKCLALFNNPKEAKLHAADCHPKFTEIEPLTPELSVAHITPDSPPFERRICERLSKISFMASGWDHPILQRQKWIRGRWYLHTYLMIDCEEVTGYIVMGLVHTIDEDEFGLRQKDIVTDMFAVENKRRQGNMRLLLNHVHKSIGRSLETVWFQEPLSQYGEVFLDKMSKETGLEYRTC